MKMVVMAHKLKGGQALKRKHENGQKHAITVEEEEEEQCNEADVETEAAIPQGTQVVLQELNIARILSGNDEIKRNQQLRKLKRWLRLRAQTSFPFNEENFMRIWKGLYYCMYMADKPLYQEEQAEKMGQLLESFTANEELCIKFFTAFLNTMRNEWFGIDQWRMDKFYMLMRRMLRHMFQQLRNIDWNEAAIRLFNQKTQQTVLAERGCAMAMSMHYMDIFFEELAKVSEGKISTDTVNLFVEPFLDYLIAQTDVKLFTHCRTRIFHHLLYQSALGREYQDKYEAWKEMGYPSSINDVEKVMNDNDVEQVEVEEETETKQLDPRAGKVDAYVPELPLDGASIVARLQQVIKEMEMPAKRRKLLKHLMKNFETYEQGEFPLGVKTMPRFKHERNTEKPILEQKVEELLQTETELYGVSRKLKKLNKRKRRKLLKSLNFDNVNIDEMDDLIAKALPDKQEILKRKRQSLMKGWVEEVVDEVQEKINEHKIKERSLKKNLKIKKRLEQLKLRQKLKLKEKLNKKTLQIAEEVLKSSPKKLKLEKNGWEVPLAEGETEFFLPSRKTAIKTANLQLAARKSLPATVTPLRRKSLKSAFRLHTSSAFSPDSVKRVKIALKHNSIQKPSDYINQLKSSPSVPYDATKKPGKGLLKPNSMPSPVDPFYVKRHSLNLNLSH